MLEDNGIPSMVGRTFIRPPSSRLGPITPGERQAIMAQSPVGATYDTLVDRESAYEVLKGKQASPAPSRERPLRRHLARQAANRSARRQ